MESFQTRIGVGSEANIKPLVTRFTRDMRLKMKTSFFYQREYLINSTMPIYFFAIVLFPLLILFSIKKFSLKESVDNKEVMSIDDSLILRGIAIIIMMIHHYSQGLVQNDKLRFYLSMGYVSVAVFLLLSGYSSYIQLSRKGEKFWDKYLFKRC